MRHEPITSRPTHYARQVWLAGLGAIKVLQKEGEHIFHELVKEGRGVEAHHRAGKAQGSTKDTSLAEAVVETKEVYQKKFETRLKECDAQLDQLREKAKKAKAEARAKIEDELTHLQAQRAAAQQKLDELRSSGEQAWEDLKNGVEKAWGDMSNALGKAVARFK
jgi:poly(hydroxyalkanoate) granule-associated protein